MIVPTISIIIPVYNVEVYLAKCLDSVLVDNAFTGQVICVNDGSTDDSLAILEEYAKRVESGEFRVENFVIINQSNAGLSAARNAGLERATGDYVFFLDSDDWVFAGSINRLLEKIEGEDVVYFNAKKYYENNQSYDENLDVPEYMHLEGQDFFAAINDIQRNIPWVCVVGGFFKRAFLQEHHLYNEPGIYHEDNYFTPQVLLAAKDVSCINEYVYVYRIRKGSITAEVTEKHIKDMLFVARNLFTIYRSMTNVANAFYIDVANMYIQLIMDSYTHRIQLCRYWKLSDSWNLIHCAYDARSRKIAKLTYIHPYVAYRYMQDMMPLYMRRFINRFV